MLTTPVRAGNEDVAAIFDALADLLEIQGENPFRVRAYRSAARTVRELPRSLASLAAEGADLAELPTIGPDLAGKILEILATGRLAALEEARRRVPVPFAELIELPGLGPRRARQLHEALGVGTLDELETALRAGRLRGVRGFGARSEERLLAELERRRGAGAPTPVRLDEAERTARPLLAQLRGAPGVGEVVVAGSYRRRKETVRDLDVLAASAAAAEATERFLAFPEVAQVLARGRTRSTVRLRSGGLQVDFRVVPEQSFGAALQYLTGAKPHTIALRRLALKRGLKLNEYGLFRADERIAGRSEAELYAALGLPLIAPELRENRGELEAAQAGRLPALVALHDIRGDLHVHTDGLPLRELAAAARSRGYEYVAVAAGGSDASRLAAQLDEIERLNDELAGRFTLLRAAEAEIVADGSLDLPAALLTRLDLTVCVLRRGFGLSRERQTRRVLRAMESPFFTILAHPAGRLVGRPQPAYVLDLERVIAAAAERGCFLELNAQPSRLDLDDLHCRLAKELGVKVAVSTAARTPAELDYLRFGVGQARRGWLEPADLLNTRPLAELRALLARRRG